MTELKPCLCGGKAKLNKVDEPFYGRILSFIECSNCGIKTPELLSETEVLSLWNTRQPQGINWQPIEELTEEEFNKLHSILLTLDDKSIYFGQRFVDDNGEHFIYLDLDVDESVRFPNFEDVQERYTYFVKVSPPKQ